MKKIWCLLFCLLLCGCSANAQCLPVTKGISFTAKITDYSAQYTCQATVSQDSVMKITVCEPEDLKGLSLTYHANGVTAEYLGLTYTPKTEKMPFCNITDTLFALFTSPHDTKIQKNKDGNYEQMSLCNQTVCKTLFAPSGLPLQVTLPDEKVTIELFDTTVFSDESHKN